MAATNTGARFAYNLAGRTSGIIRQFIIGDSETMTVGDFCTTNTSGEVQPAAAGELLLGVCVGIVDVDGINMDNSKRSITGSGASWTSSTQTFVAGSDNSSTDYVKALVDIDPFSVWSCEPDATIGTTTSSGNSAFFGSYTDLADEDEVDETNNSAAFNTVAQLFIWGTDPEDTTRGLYSIAEHVFWGQ
jgi:hypothetical protein